MQHIAQREAALETFALEANPPTASGIEQALSAFERDGYCLLQNIVEPALCDEVVADYVRYLSEHRMEADENVDNIGRHLRLVNFHLWSDAAMRLGATTQPMQLLDRIFGAPASLYTSLFFEYSTEQAVHRDSPFFETFPRNLFVGVWFALEDIDPKSGPLFVHAGGHRKDATPEVCVAEARERWPHATGDELIAAALEIYYRNVADVATSCGAPITLPIRKGDVVVWHAQAPHGGSQAIEKSLTRRSMVFHCTPEDVQVYQHDVFFLHQGEPPPKRYGYKTAYGRQVALAGGTAFQK